ncbi:MAG TPA: hypothetical protein VEG32_13810 [Clostridia bacterium]|nr:hypothetical protein [Clostridia bacterium]
MGLDIRTPIGLMFSVLGLILAGFGLIGSREIYGKSLGINVNLWWGIVLLAFGAMMLVFGLRTSKAQAEAERVEH